MKAIRVTTFGDPDVLKVENVPIPKPSAGQVLVRVLSAGVNPVETYRRSGNYAILPTLPWIPGTDGAGFVEQVGENVSSVKEGDRVWLVAGLGTYAQYCIAEASAVQSLPPNITFDAGAGLWVAYATAYHALYHIGQPNKKPKILVHGASGGVGLACLQFARQIPDSLVIGTAGTAEGCALVASLGATPLNHRQPGYQEEVMKLTHHEGVDIVLEMLANVNLASDLKLLAKYGRVCIIGNRGNIEINPRDLMAKRSSIRGVMLGGATPEEQNEIVHAINEGLCSGTLQPHVGKVYKLLEAPNAHCDILSNTGATGKLVLHPWDE